MEGEDLLWMGKDGGKMHLTPQHHQRVVVAHNPWDQCNNLIVIMSKGKDIMPEGKPAKPTLHNIVTT